MKSSLTIVVLLVAASSWRSASCQDKPDGKKITVRGLVRSPDGKPIEKATVIFSLSGRAGKPIVVYTDSDGKYEQTLDLAESETFDVFYSHSDSGRAEVCNLSRKHDQAISIFLYQSAILDKMSVDAVFKELAAFEHAAFLAYYSHENEPLTLQLREQLSTDGVQARLQNFTKRKYADQGEARLIQDKVGTVGKIMGKKF